MSLHPHQQALIADVQAAFAQGHNAVLMQGCTGIGKTHCAAHGVIRPSVDRGRRFVFAAHLEELLDDTAGRLTALGVPCGTVKAGRPSQPASPVQVCSTPTLARMLERGEELPPADRIIIDEAHRSSSRTNREVLAYYRSRRAKILGLTATPARGDDQPLDEFTALVQGPSFRWLIEHGYLVKPEVFAPAKILDQGVAEDPVTVVSARAFHRRGIVFAPSAREAIRIADVLTTLGHATEAIIESTDADTRRSVRDRLASGETRHVVTVRALLEGFDAPVLDCAVLCAAFTTISPFLQAVGRVVRAYPGKVDAWVFDLRGAVYIHNVPDADRAWSLEGAQGRSDEEALKALRTCRDCHATFPVAAVCPRCGSRYQTDPRPLRIQRAELWAQSGVPTEVRAHKYLDGAVRGLLNRRPDISPQWARSAVLSKAPRWVREALSAAA